MSLQTNLLRSAAAVRRVLSDKALPSLVSGPRQRLQTSRLYSARSRLARYQPLVAVKMAPPPPSVAEIEHVASASAANGASKDKVYTPSHPGHFHVVFGENFGSKLLADRGFKKGDVIAKIAGGRSHVAKRYTSIQIDINEHYEFDSDLVYMNHSCNPSCNVDTDSRAVVAARDLAAGDELLFFYPSTEWDMDQPFECWCGAAQCIRHVRGAKHLPDSTFEGRFVASHIKELLSQRGKQRNVN